MKQTLSVLLCSILFTQCSEKREMSPEQKKGYVNEVNAWHATRMEKVQAPDGWLNLIGLLWLEPGINTFGSSNKNDIVFPQGKIAPEAGYFTVTDNQVSIMVNNGVDIRSDFIPVSDKIIFSADSSTNVVLSSGSLVWNIIKRDTKLGIRLRDLESEAIKSFKGVARFEVDPKYRVDARLEKHDSLRTIDITNAIGQTSAQPSPGTLKFTLFGKEQHLDVLAGNEKEFFVIFADSTTGRTTYGGGRFIYVTKPTGDGLVTLDFNRSYNPPCVFSPYATCPLPPQQNYLTVSVEAGEQDYVSHNMTMPAPDAIINKR